MSTLVATNLQVGSDGTATNNFTVYQPTVPDGTLRIGNGNSGSATSRVAITSAGDVGIGTSSPAGRLEVKSSNTSRWWLENDSSATNTKMVFANSAGAVNRARYQALEHYFQTGNITDAAILDSSGNLGLGVTPNSPDYRSISVSYTGHSLIARSNNLLTLSMNAYYNSGFKYSASSVGASLYEQNNGGHNFYTAPSGTAGNAISFTQAMTLDASGNLLVGRTTSNGTAYRFEVDSSSDTRIGINVGGSLTGLLQATTNTLSLAAIGASGVLTFNSNGQERARITSGGEVYIAGTTDQGAYNLQVNGTGVWGAGAYVNGSDERLKDNIQTLDDGLAVVTQLRPVTFQYKPEHSKDQSVQPGFIAQELQQAMAGKDYVDGVVQSGPEYLNVAYQNLIPILTKAIQELKAELDAAKARLAAAGI